MNKLLFTLAAIFLYQIAPLLGAPHLILHWKMLAIMATAAAIWLSQPALRGHDVEAHRNADRNTVLIILAEPMLKLLFPQQQILAVTTQFTITLVGVGTLQRAKR